MAKKIAAGLLLLLILAAAIAYVMVNARIGDPDQRFRIKVARSDNAGDVRHKLISAGADINSTTYSILMVLTKTDRQIQPGVYDIPGGLTHYELIDWFRQGRVLTSKVTVPEGLTVREIIPILSRGVPTDSAELAALLADSSYFATFDLEAPGFEGYLFPETYIFFTDEEPEAVVTSMVDMFKSVFDKAAQERTVEEGMTMNEVVTLASLIEAEATAGSERRLISSVFHNRLTRGLMLQCDPTVIYALGSLDRPLMKKDLLYESPYNTYLHYGLPPGPICSPGRASLEAALYPAESDFYYFVADGSGKHIFSETLEEHNRARQRVKREMKSGR